MKRITGKARIQIVVEVDASSWGEDCGIKQLHDHAAESGVSILREALKNYGNIRIVGEPKVIGVLTVED